MSKLEDLINEMCPDGVEYKTLDKICKIKGRIGFRGYTRNDLVKEVEGAITLSLSNIKNQEMDFSNCSYISWFKYDESPEIKVAVGDVIFTKTASIGKTALIKYLPKEATINPQLVVLKEIECNSGFLAYVLKSDKIQNLVKQLAGVGSVPNIPQSSLAKLEIPIPPLEIQNEIVRILDKFSSLEEELEQKLGEELVLRKKQYEYYRDKLLTFDDSVEWKTLGEIAKYSNTRIKNSEMKPYTYVSVENLLQQKQGVEFTSKIPDGNNSIQYLKNDILIGNIRPYLRKIWLSDREGGTNGDVLAIRILDEYKTKIIPNYLFYILSSEDFFDYDIQYSKGAKMPRGSKEDVMKYKIPVPPLSEQERIVSILDKFETLCNDLTAGLPAEISARKKQYEYYRDKLLTFKRKDC